MPDLRFFQVTGQKALQELAEITGSDLAKDSDKDVTVSNVAPLDQAGADDLSFLDNARYKEQFSQTKAGACVIHPDMVDIAPANIALLLTPHPYKTYAKIAQIFYPDRKPTADISEQAHIDPSASIADGCTIEPGAVIKAGAEIGTASWIESNAVIGKNVVIGAHCRIGANATISHTIMGDHSRIYPGCRIGQDGFGFAIDPAGHVKVPQLGRVIIEDHVEIGANTTIDRGAGPDTVIGQGTWIDNLVQIGHNVKIGKGCVIVAQVGISGSTTIEDYVVFGGQAGIAGHLTVGQGARVAAQSGIMRDVEAGSELMGSPAVPRRQFMKQVAWLKRMTTKDKS